jgi:hemoglobin
MSSKNDITDPADVKLLVDTFYKQVMTDELIGHYFTKIVPVDFEKHMPTMYSFWENVLFCTGEDKGNPMNKHASMDKISPLQQNYFDRWMHLWNNNVNKLFSGTKAEEAKSKTDQIAKLMFLNIKNR